MTTNNTRPLPPEENRRILRRLSLAGLLGNLSLSVLKLLGGLLGHSGALLSDAANSLGDVFSTGIAALGVKLSQKDADKAHPYGHERVECLATLTLGLLLLATALGIGVRGFRSIFAADTLPAVPGPLAVAAAIASLLIKELLYHYTRRQAQRIQSSVFLAAAWDHRSDAFASLGALAGILGARLGFPALDSIASLLIGLLILKTAATVTKDAVSKMLDTACDESFEAELRAFIEGRAGVLRVDVLHTRLFGENVYVDLEIALDGSLSLRESHSIAQQVHDEVEQRFPNIKHIMIHTNPLDDSETV